MTSTTPRLSKSKVLAGLQCRRRVWLRCNEPKRATPPDAATRAAFEAGSEVGRQAQRLFPGGVLVKEPAWEHAAAVERTRRLLGEGSVPAIFEAAFEHAGVRIRADVLERLPDGPFGLREVKSSTSVKAVHLDDLTVQCLVLEGCGVSVGSVELIHVDRSYVRGPDGIDWPLFFVRVDCRSEVEAQRRAMADTVEALHSVVAGLGEPDVEPGPHCKVPYPCEFWDWCTRAKPEDWIWRLPGLQPARFEWLRASGVERIGAIPNDARLSARQERAREAVRSGRLCVAPDLAEALRPLGPPAWYLDFETVNPAIPLYEGTRPYQPIPFQWSLHRSDTEERLEHRAFLADGRGDPRRAFAESLLEALGSDGLPILVYSSFETARLSELAECFPELGEPLGHLIGRCVDLLAIVRDHVYHPAFGGSFSLKRVVPALEPGFHWGGASEIREGATAAASFARILSGELDRATQSRLRAQLLTYCSRDTEALVALHQALRAMG